MEFLRSIRSTGYEDMAKGKITKIWYGETVVTPAELIEFYTAEQKMLLISPEEVALWVLDKKKDGTVQLLTYGLSFKSFKQSLIEKEIKNARFRAKREYAHGHKKKQRAEYAASEQLKKDAEKYWKPVVDSWTREILRQKYRECLQGEIIKWLKQAADKWNKEREEELKTNILHRVPKRYPDLYPLARSIKRHFVLHIGPTNSGKTYSAMERLKAVGEGIYLAPLRLLAFEQYEALNLSGFPCSLITGEEESTVVGAKFQSSTIEMLSITEKYKIAVIDEAQMIANLSRGGAWTTAILGLYCDEIHVCMSPDAENIVTKLIAECGDTCEVVRHKRQTPLFAERKTFQFPQDVRKHDALIVFSKAHVHGVALELQEKGYRVSIIYGRLPYDVRQHEAMRFADGDTDVLVATDAIGMGLNLPIQRVVFLEMRKFDGTETRPLTLKEFQQIAGRAGRRGIYEEGTCATTAPYSHLMKELHAIPEPITEAVIGFPEQLIGVPGRLSDTIKQWDELSTIEGYKHADSSELLDRALNLEQYTTDKELIYKFITIPFSEKSGAADLWKECFLHELNGDAYPFEDMCRQFPIHADLPSISDLEDAHKFCDMAYAYASRFGRGEDIPLILARKGAISRSIMELLAKQKLEPKLCKCCGRPIPWNFPYRICDDCHLQVGNKS